MPWVSREIDTKRWHDRLRLCASKHKATWRWTKKSTTIFRACSLIEEFGSQSASGGRMAFLVLSLRTKHTGVVEKSLQKVNMKLKAASLWHAMAGCHSITQNRSRPLPGSMFRNVCHDMPRLSFGRACSNLSEYWILKTSRHRKVTPRNAFRWHTPEQLTAQKMRPEPDRLP